MTHPKLTSINDRTQALIENEKRRDRFIRRVSIAAWSMTGFLVLVVAVMVTGQVVEMTRIGLTTGLPFMTVMSSAMPLIDVLWKLSLLVATLSTIGIFLRLRTASLTEIQLRLAALEEMIASQPDSRHD
jgi:hypothetical protein